MKRRCAPCPCILIMALWSCSFLSVPAAGAGAGVPRLFAQAQGARPQSGASAAKKSINRTTDVIIRIAIVAGLSVLVAACSFFGLFPWLLRQQMLPLYAFAIATIVTMSSFFLLILGVWLKYLQFLTQIGY